MLSLGKIVLVLAVIYFVAKIARLFGGQDRRAGAAAPTPKPKTGVETLSRCPVCGVFRADAGPCDRPDCPTRARS